MAEITVTIRQRRSQERAVTKTLEVRDEVASRIVGEARRVWIEHTLAPMVPEDEWGSWRTTRFDIEGV